MPNLEWKILLVDDDRDDYVLIRDIVYEFGGQSSNLAWTAKYDVGLEEIHQHVTRPLSGLKLAPYMGCLVSRPDYDDRWQHREHPHALDQLLLHLGAERVAPILDLLSARGYGGVLTLEVFGREDFFSSRSLVAEVVDGKT